MTGPEISQSVLLFEIRPQLQDMVKRYTSSKVMRHTIVEKTILLALDNPAIVLDSPLDENLCNLLHQTALKELERAKKAFSNEDLNNPIR
ncbi:hypothetical protein [Agrobacterium sp.]|jgi:hypothetical protein|uniref:hypothetical protein n=1 Tax=Agrobacterium sp. TaxID=361 RepID=UPI0028AA7263|nr:hypothetical protein [Agrobacterium sp.]